MVRSAHLALRVGAQRADLCRLLAIRTRSHTGTWRPPCRGGPPSSCHSGAPLSLLARRRGILLSKERSGERSRMSRARSRSVGENSAAAREPTSASSSSPARSPFSNPSSHRGARTTAQTSIGSREAAADRGPRWRAATFDARTRACAATPIVRRCAASHATPTAETRGSASRARRRTTRGTRRPSSNTRYRR